MMFTNSCSIFNRINLSSGMSEMMYATGTSKIPTSLPSCAPMTRLLKKSSREMVGKDAYYLVM